MFKNVSGTIEFVHLPGTMRSLARKKWTLPVQNLNCQPKIQQWLKEKGRGARFEVFTGRLVSASLVGGQNLRGEPYVEVPKA